MNKADITIDMDKQCSKCGQPGAAQNGWCLACIAEYVGKGGYMEVKVLIKDIDKLKTSTELREEKDKEGKVILRKLVSKISFEAEVLPLDLSNVHHLLFGAVPVHVIIGSPQAVMEIIEHEGAFAEVK